MKTRLISLMIVLGASAALYGQGAPAAPPAPAAPHVQKFEKKIVIRGEMGKWWRDAEITKKLQLSDSQMQQLDQIFYDHKVKLIDYGAEMEKQDLKLQALLDADAPNEGEIGAQVDRVLAARGKLEREHTFMNLDLRKVLSLDQWRQLKAIRGDRGAGDNVIFLKKFGPGAGPVQAPLPMEWDMEIGTAPEPNL
ncbi:MAG TPA: periplasmic heavy metal sensor [Terriglobales bacterium]|nr:periplasmic heavy metal sensor [Terriglobales bacterium]